jgi:hypothetical protein
VPRGAAAPPTAGADRDHDAVLDETLRAAGVPTHRLEPHHLVGAATLMAKQGLTPADAYERFVMQSVPELGLIDPAGWQDLYGFGAGVQPASAQQNETPEQRDLKRWPVGQAPTNEGRETGPSDSRPPVARSQDPPLAMVPQPPTTEHSETQVPFVLAAMDESERRRLLGEKPQLPSGGGGGGGYGGSTASGRSLFRRPTSAFHHTFERQISGIERKGLKAGQYATPTENLSPMQAQIDLALAPNYGLRDVRLRIDLEGLRRDGYKIPQITPVGRRYGMPGGGYEMQFPYRIPPKYITVIRP